MVKSKKMSKTSIAVIILALLLVLIMVLGITGAWFTDKHDPSDVTGQSLSFGKIGEVELTVTGFTWTQGVNEDAISGGRTVVMPGDNVKGGRIHIAYTGTGVRDVYYVLVKDGAFYTLNSSSGLVAITEVSGVGEAGELTTAGIDFDMRNTYIEVTADGESTGLEVKWANRESLTNKYEEADDFNFLTIANGDYEVRIIQQDNLDAEAAYALLKAGTLIVEKS